MSTCSYPEVEHPGFPCAHPPMVDERPTMGHHIAVIWCCVTEQWQANEVTGAATMSLADAAQIAEDDVCHWGDVGAVVDLNERRVASVVGTIHDQRHAQGALALADRLMAWVDETIAMANA